MRELAELALLRPRTVRGHAVKYAWDHPELSPAYAGYPEPATPPGTAAPFWGDVLTARSSTPLPTEAPTPPPTPHRSRGRGRCGATPRINGRRTPARNLTHTTTGPDGTLRTLKLTKSQMRALEAEFALAGLTWDHQITSAAPGGEAITHYADSSTIRGGLPLDFPETLRDEFFTRCAAASFRWGLDPDARSEYQTSLALALREAGYPPLDAPEYERVHEETFPLARYPEYHLATSLELVNVSAALAHPERESLAAYLAAGGGVQVRVDANGSIASALAGGHLVLGSDGSAAKLRSYDLLGENLRCYTCAKPRGMCLCGSGVTNRERLEMRLRDSWAYAALGKVKRASWMSSPQEHRWGRDWAVRPSLTDHATAAATRTEVEAVLSYVLGPEEWERARAELGSELGYDVAMLCVQTNSKPAELLTPATSRAIVDGMRQADVVVRRFHPRHGHILYQTFDAEPSPRDADGKASRTEVYLGRDGVYMWAARMESQTVLRRAGLGTQDDIRYITVSRGVRWRPAEHDHLLGDGHAEYVDTGFSGSIVRGILQERAAAGTGGDDGKVHHHARLLSSTTAALVAKPLHREKGMEHAAAIAIEHGPKPHRTVGDVNELAEPTGAIEQLLFRQTLRSIRREARRDAEEIVRGRRPRRLLGPMDEGGEFYESAWMKEKMEAAPKPSWLAQKQSPSSKWGKLKGWLQGGGFTSTLSPTELAAQSSWYTGL